MTETPLTPHDGWSREQLLAYQRDRLEALLRHAADASPYYREVLGPRPDARWLEQLPPLSKTTLMEEFDRIVTDPALSRAVLERMLDEQPGALYKGEYRLFSTSGATGEPALLVYSRAEFAQWVTVTVRALAQAGVKPDTRLAAIGAPNPLHISRRLIDSIGDARPGHVPELYVTTPISELVEVLNDFQPEAIATYSSIAGLLADEQLDGALQIRPTLVLVTAEVLTEQAEQRITEAWGFAPTHLYASTEAPVLACGRPGDRALSIREDQVILEVVDEENTPVPPGTPGHKVLLTNLVNRAQPLIRYELNDSVELAAGPRPTTPPYRRIARIEGRSDDILQFPGRDGGGKVVVHPYLLHAAFTAFPQISQYQIVHDDHRLRTRILLRPSAAPGTAERLREALQVALQKAGAAPPLIEVEPVERIDRDRGPAAKTKVIAALAAVCAAAAAFAASASARTTFVASGYLGTLRGSHAFVAVVLGERGGLRAYVSDSSRVAERFAGQADGSRELSLSSRHGYRLRVSIAGGRASGTVRFPSGARHVFSAVAVVRPGHLYRIDVTTAGRRLLGGWIVWQPGDALGRVFPSPSTQLGRAS